MKLLQKIFLRMAFLFLMFVALAASTNIWGQCGKVNKDSNAFRTVSEKYREKLIRRFEIYLQKKCDENIEEIYDLLISSFRELNRKEDFVNQMTAYYSGKDRFVSFAPQNADEFSSSKGTKISFWFIKGCITEVINGKKRSKETVLEAYLEDSEIFFTDITSRPNPIGKDRKCKS